MSDDGVSIEHIRRLFARFHGMYGNVALDRFRTGQTDQDGADVGVVSAQRHWHKRLRQFTPEVIAGALVRCETSYKTHPPTLPEFVDLCRQVSVVEQKDSRPELPMPQELRSSYVREVREQIAKVMAERRGDIQTPLSAGLPFLLSLIARSASYAGDDEAKVLMRLEGKYGARQKACEQA